MQQQPEQSHEQRRTSEHGRHGSDLRRGSEAEHPSWEQAASREAKPSVRVGNKRQAEMKPEQLAQLVDIAFCKIVAESSAEDLAFNRLTNGRSRGEVHNLAEHSVGQHYSSSGLHRSEARAAAAPPKAAER